MSRIRTAEAAGNKYQGQVGGDQYFTVQAPSSDKAVQGYKQQVEQRSRTQAKELERDLTQERSEKEYKDGLHVRWLQKENQKEKDKLAAIQQVDKSNLDLKKQWVGAVDNLRVAEVQAQGQVAQANLKAVGGVVKGLTSLSSSYLKYKTEMIEIQEEEQIKNETISMLGGVQGAIVGETAVANETVLQNAEVAEVNAIRTSVVDPVTRDDAMAPTQLARTANNNRSIATQNLGIGMEPALRDFMESDVKIRFPNGDVKLPKEASNSTEVTFALQVGLGQYMGGANLRSMSTSRLNVLANQANNSMRSLGGEYSKIARNNRVSNLQYSALTDFAKSYRGGQPITILDVDKLANAYALDPNITPQEGLKKAVTDIIGIYKNSNGGKGDDVSMLALSEIRLRNNLTIGDLFADEINKAVNESNSDFDKYEANLNDDIKDDMFARLAKTDNREERIAIAEETIKQLEAKGLYEYAGELEDDIQKLSLPGQGKVEFNNTLNEINNGEITDPEQIEDKVNLNQLSATQGEELKNKLKIKNESRTPNDQQTKAFAKARADATYNRIGAALKYNTKDQNGNFVLGNQKAVDEMPPAEMARVREALRTDYNRVMNKVLEQNPDLLQPGKESEKLEALATAAAEWDKSQLGAGGKWDLTDTTVEGEAERPDGKSIEQVNPAFAKMLRKNIDNPQSYASPFAAGTGHKMNSLAPKDFVETVENTGITNAVRDRFNPLRGDKLVNKGAAQGWINQYNNGVIDPSLRSYANKMGRTPLELLRSQMFAYPSLREQDLNFPEPVSNTSYSGPDGNSTAPLTAVQGAELLMSMGVPEKGAAWLSGNIATESGWVPNRQPWDDVGAPAGGLVSWRAGRLQAIEQQIGRPVTEITSREQLNYMLNEMKTKYNTGQVRVYDRFMNPRSSDRQLIEASVKFWGYGVEGDRYSNARAIQRDLGNFSQPSNSGGRDLTSYKSQVSSITYDSGQPGIDIFFEDHNFPAVLEGRVKDIGYQVNGDGSGYGHFLVIESRDPSTGQPVDVLYGHLPTAPTQAIGQSINRGEIIGKQGGTGSVQSYDGTIASIDFLAPAPRGSGSMTPYGNYQQLRESIAQQLR